MRVIVGCEFSGVVREAFRAKGHDAWSCDLLPAEDNSPYHIQGDILDHLHRGWDLGIFHPPCTYLCSSGLHWNKRVEGRSKKTEEALEFVSKLLNADIDKIALENPVGCISTRIRKPDQIFNFYQSGADMSKTTCLWLKNLPKLEFRPEEARAPRIVNGKKRWGNQTDSGQNRLGPSDDRWAKRSFTPPEVAKKMAEQWG